MKNCAHCKQSKPLIDFHKHKTRGHQPICRVCAAQMSRARHDVLRERNKRINPYAAGGEKRCGKCKKVKPVRFFGATLRTASGLGSRCKECVREINATPESKARRQPGQKRRAERLALAVGGVFSLARNDYRARIQFYGGRCAYCEQAPATELDHAVPISRGGGNWAANIRPACVECNRSKGSQVYGKEWMPFSKRPHRPPEVRSLRGEEHPASKVTPAQIQEMRAKYKPRVYTQDMLAAEYGLHRGHISRIVRSKNWRHVDV